MQLKQIWGYGLLLRGDTINDRYVTNYVVSRSYVVNYAG